MQSQEPPRATNPGGGTTWTARVLGPLDVRAGESAVGLGGPQQRLVLALLLVRAGRPVATEQLISDVWPDDPPPRARKTIQVYASHLRRALGGADGVLRSVANGYRLDSDRMTIDALTFERAAGDAHPPNGADPAATARRIRTALELWLGPPYADVPDAEPIRAERVRLAELRLVAVERRIDAELALGLGRELIGELEALTIEHPYRERFVGQLMLAQYRAGRQADALRTMRRARRILDEQLGIEPGSELRTLERRILTQDSALQPSTGVMSSEQVVPPEPPPAPLGAIRGYELREVIAATGPVTGYRAYQPSVGREVAVAVIERTRANAATFVRRFDADSQRIAELEHPHIVALLDHWRDPDGAYLVTRWIRGRRLLDVLEAQPLSPVTALRMTSQLGAALSSMHRAGLVHGDVTAATVRLDEDGNAYLGDVAVTHLLRGAGVDADDAANAASARHPTAPTADVLGLAALTVEMLTGSRPAAGTDVTDERVAPALRAVLGSALAADPAERPGGIDALVRALRRAAGVDTVGVADEAPRPFAEVRNPYKGLRAFGRADAQDFHGREELVTQLVTASAQHRLVAVVGPSGSGKSSVVRAGLLPQVADRPVLVAEMFPGRFPFEELATALLRVAVDRPRGMIDDLTSDERGLLRVVKQVLPDDGHEVLLVIDQFEELFSLVRDADTQLAFMRAVSVALEDPRSQLRVVVTLRADFFDRPLQDARFGELLKRGLIPVTAPTRDELARAVSQPAAAVGLDLEPGLTGEIVADVEGQPGVLPLLQYALTELFRTRTSNRLTADDYRRIGGVTGALGARAEELYDDLQATGQEAARQVFLRLVTAGEGADDVRRRVRLTELTTLPLDRADLDVVLERYGSHRLLSFDRDPVTRGPTVEVAHEALLREWRRLRGWVDARRADLILHRRFAAAVDEWEFAGRDDSFLAHGGRLAQFEEGVADSELRLTEPEQDFLESSRARRAAERQAAEERARRQARTNRRLRRLLTGVGVLTLVAAVVGAFAFTQAREASAAAVAAEARRVGAQALAAGDIDRALLLAVEGVRLDDSTDTRANLLTTLGRSPELVGVLRGDPDRAFGTVTISADGETGAVYDDANRVHFFDVAARQVLATYETAEFDATATLVTGRALFHPGDGPVAVSVSTLNPPAVRLLDPVSFEELPASLGGVTLDGAPAPHLLPWGMAYSPDGTRLAVAFDNYPSRRYPVADRSLVAVWDLAAPEQPEVQLTDVAAYTHDVAFSPDGRSLYTASHAAPPGFETDAAVTVYDLDTASVVRTLEVPSHPFVLSPDGTRIAVATAAPELVDSATGTDVLVLDATTGEQVQRLRGHTGPVTALAFSDDGSLLASAASDHAVALWDVASGDRVDLLEGHAGGVTGVAFGPDGDTVISSGVDGAVLVWDRAGDRRFVSVREISGGLLARSTTAFTDDLSIVSPSGDAVLSISSAPDGAIVSRTHLQIVDARTGRAGAVVEAGHGPFATAAWHPDGGQFATAGTDATVRVWDAATTTVVAEQFLGGDFPVTGIAYVDGGAQLMIAGRNSFPLQRLDAETLAPTSESTPLFNGWWPGLFGDPDSNTIGMVASAKALDISANEDDHEDRLLLLDVDSGAVRHDVALGFDGARAAMAPDGGHIAVAGDGGQVALVDVVDGAMVRPPTAAHDGPVAAISYAPGGDLVASGGSDGRVALWDGTTADLLGRVQVTAADTAVYVGFAADGTTITAATQDGRIHTIDVRPDRWIEQACAIAGRNLTRGEWREAFGDRPYRETCGRG